MHCVLVNHFGVGLPINCSKFIEDLSAHYDDIDFARKLKLECFNLSPF